MAVGRTSSTGLPWLVASSDLTNGSDIIYPTSVAGTGVTLLGGQVSFSAATSVSVNGCFTSAYENYRVVITGFQSAAVSYNMRLRASGADNSTSSYRYSWTALNDAASVANSASVGTTQTQFEMYGARVNESHLALDMMRPQLSVATTFTAQSCVDQSPTVFQVVGAGKFTTTTQFDGFTLYPGSGTVTGTIRVYGMRNY